MNEITKIVPKRKESIVKIQKYAEKFENFVKQTCGNEFKQVSDYTGVNNKIKMIHNIENGIPHECFIIPSNFQKKPYCPVCSGKQVSPGYNDFNTLYPELSKYLLNYEDGASIAKSSRERKNIKCPYCGYIFSKRICDLVTYGFSCPRCNDGISYPNKFMFNSLLQIQNTFKILIREYSPEWCYFNIDNKTHKGKYDIYFELYNNKKYIIEMDGAFHSNDNKMNGMTMEYSCVIDREKDKLASKHDIDIIRINCNYGKYDKYEYILKNILESKLKNIINLNEIDFNKSNIDSLNSYLLKSCDMWEQGFTTKEIENALHISNTTVCDYLKRGNKYGLCKYNKKISRDRSCGRKVYLLTTGELFNTMTEGANKYNINKTQIFDCCNEKNNIGGKHPITGEGLVWIYYDKYINMTDDDIIKYKNKENKLCEKVICLNDNKIFDSIQSAKIWCGNGGDNISSCCSGKRKTAGKHPVTKEPLRWIYYKDYLKLNNNINI